MGFMPVQESCSASSASHLCTMCPVKLQEGEEESEEEEEAEPEKAQKPAPAPPPTRAAPRPRGAKGRRQTPRDQEDIDEILRELPQAAGEARSIGEAGPSDGRALKQAQRPLLAVSGRHLKASEELKRMFGSDAIEEDDEAGAAYAGRLRWFLWCLERSCWCATAHRVHPCLPTLMAFMARRER